MFPSIIVRKLPVVLLVCLMSKVAFGEPIVLESSAVNTVQIKAIQLRGAKVFEIQLGGGSNQPPANTWITGKASTVVGKKKYSGFYRLSTDPEYQLKMLHKSAVLDADEYRFVQGNEILYFEFTPTSSFIDPWLTGRIVVASARQQARDDGNRKKPDQNGNQNNENQNGNQDGEQNGDEHPPIALAGQMSAPMGGSLSKLFGPGECQLLLSVGGNQRLSELQLGNTLSGMSLQQGSFSLDRK